MTGARAALPDSVVGTGPAVPDRRRRPARILRRAVWWDLRLLTRYQVATVAVAVTAAYVLVFRAIPAARTDAVAVLLVFSDPTMIGFLFIGVLVLFERGANTLQAVVVTPLSSGQYLWSKAIALTTVAVPCGLAMAVASHGAAVNPALLVAGVALSSVLFVFVGFVAVARVRSVNEYLLIVPVFLVPAVLPILDTVGLVESPLFYLFPTHASLVLLAAAVTTRPGWEQLYGVLYLSAAVAGAFGWAKRSFEGRIRQAGAR
ncbi:hypothetical protein O7627_15620 [Solwaraspora sp. WMMD1047]|uniref:fluoroquinolone export ABC transporter permease subunit n=1 Tax=Solwaraspora sp. WMMD1047 TaxID=3016102 RepID=UPI0024164A71|nr:hypothetical protein [Solwaraspora sp. WMMD1047]MDG4830723.1 hypothetical protein [Solwaraspora sp. WMMD1047]